VARDRLQSVEIRVLAVWAAFAAYIVVIGGDVLQVHRFWLPILPVGALLVARGSTWVGGWIAARRSGSRKLAAAVSAAVIVATVGGGLARNWEGIQGRRNTEIGFVLNMRQTGEWLGQNLPPGSSIAITTIGAIGYYSGLHVIDMLGLTDREIARNPKLIPGLKDTWREIKYNAESVLARRPDAILFSTGVRPSAAAEKALYLYQDFYRSYFAYNFRSTSNRTHVQVAFRRRPDAPEFSPELVGIGDLGFLEEYIEGHLAQSRHADFEGAVEHFRRADEMSGGLCSWARQWLGTALYDSGREEEGMRILRAELAEDPYCLSAMMRIADAELNGGNLDGAAGMFRRITDVCPDDALAWLGLAETTRLRGDPERAYRYALEGIRRWDVSPPHLALFGSIAIQTRNFDTAEAVYERALGVDPDFAPARQALELLPRFRDGSLRIPDGADGVPKRVDPPPSGNR
ncbi:MAG: tetratricopeptide repeat protein, partial [Gemmatimonadetes bacterium]|nr:tetratricopeptide repeat protein [Gemmatimonadota bacterium]